MIHLANISIRRPRAALLVWAALALALSLVGLGVRHSLSPSIVVVPGTESSRAQTLTEGAFGPSVLVPILLEGPARQLDQQGPRLVVALSKRPDTRVMSAWSKGAAGTELRPRPTAAMVVVAVARSERAMVQTVQPQIEKTVHRVVSGPVSAHITGQPTLDRALRDEAIATTRRAELIGTGLLFLVLLAGLRAPVAALLVAAFGAVTSLAGMGTMALLGKAVETDPIAVTLGSLTGLALGVGFALMILDRFREERRAAAGRVPTSDVIAAAVATTGRAVLVSGTAVVVALVLATLIAPTTILTSVGIGVLLCAALATGAAVVVMPAALGLLGPRIEAFSFPAPRPLTRAWDWLVGRARWVLRWPVLAGAFATVALVALALPVRTLDTGPPDVTMLPSGSQARLDFERVGAVMGPGWPTPFNIVVVSTTRPLTAPALLRDLRSYQQRLARDARVESVIGPGAFLTQSNQLKALPKGLKSSSKMLKGSKRDLARLQSGLHQAAGGSAQLQSGMRTAAAGAGQLRGGSGAAGSGAGQLRAGLTQAHSGSGRISSGLHDALAGARALQAGAADALAGAKTLSGGLGTANSKVKAGLPAFGGLVTSVAGARTGVAAAYGNVQSAASQIALALSRLSAMTAGKSDPQYAGALAALGSARGMTDSARSQLAGATPKLDAAALVSSAASKQVSDLSQGLQALYAGSGKLAAGISKLRAGNSTLAQGIARLSSGGSELTGGLQALEAGSAALESGIGQLTSGAGQLQSGLSGGVAPAGQLTSGLGTMEAGVAKFRGNLPSTRDIEKLNRQSPGLFDSGYFVLAAIEGAPSGDRAVASFALNLERGGNAGQIVVVPRRPARSEATRDLAGDLRTSASGFARATGTQVAVGGPAANLADFTSETNSRLPLVVVALALAVAAVLMAALRAIVLPLVAVASDLLVALATFGVLELLFGGHDPVLGGPGYVDPMSVIGIFAAIFGISMIYAVVLLARTRERYLESGDPVESLAFGLRHTASVATGAAIVTVAAAVPFVFSDLLNARQFGIGVAVAVALEALVVRPVLLPAAIRLLGHRAWWPTGRPVAPRRAAAPPPAPTGGAAPA